MGQKANWGITAEEVLIAIPNFPVLIDWNAENIMLDRTQAADIQEPGESVIMSVCDIVIPGVLGADGDQWGEQ